jgi:hypothetical protein
MGFEAMNTGFTDLELAFVSLSLSLYTFGTISALFGLNHKIITQAQYSFVVGTVIASAVIPTVVANMSFLPGHLLPGKDDEHVPERFPSNQRRLEQSRRSLWHAKQIKSMKRSSSHMMAHHICREPQISLFRWLSFVVQSIGLCCDSSSRASSPS